MSKKFDNIFDKIITKENFRQAHKNTQKGPLKYQKGSLKFRENLSYNLENLRQSVINETYEPNGYYSFHVYEPKERLVYAPHYQDKLVHHAINNVLRDIYEPCFIYDSYSCIRNKGSHRAANKIQANLKSAKSKYKNPYIVKIDIKKFFYSVNREILKKIITKKIKCKKTLKLLFKIINSNPEKKGLALGNLISQIFANILLNQLDQFAKRILKIKYYVRYADDITLVCSSKGIARIIFEKIINFLNNELDLQAHKEKSKIFPLEQGVNTIGFKIHYSHKLLRNDSKKKIKRKCKKFPSLIAENKITIAKAEQMLNSWHGHARNSNSYNFIKKLEKRHEYLYHSKKFVII